MEHIPLKTNSAQSREPADPVMVEFDDTSAISPVPIFVTTTTLSQGAGMKSPDT